MRWLFTKLTTFGGNCETYRHAAGAVPSEFLEILVPGPNGEPVRVWYACRECHTGLLRGYIEQTERNGNAGAE